MFVSSKKKKKKKKNEDVTCVTRQEVEERHGEDNPDRQNTTVRWETDRPTPKSYRKRDKETALKQTEKKKKKKKKEKEEEKKKRETGKKERKAIHDARG